MSTVVVADESPAEEVAEEVAEAVEAVEEVADAVSDAVMDATTISLVERITRLEEAHNTLAAVVQASVEKLEGLKMTDEIQQQQIERTQETVTEVATEAADAIQETVEDVAEASPEIEPDEVPTTREHPFFRKWGKR